MKIHMFIYWTKLESLDKKCNKFRKGLPTSILDKVGDYWKTARLNIEIEY